MKSRVRNIVFVGLFAALSYVLYLFPKFSILPAFPWLEIDFSDLPALYASVSFSPLYGVIVVLIKNLLHLSASTTGAVGELSNFLIGSVFVCACGLLFRLIRHRSVFIRAVASSFLAVPFQLVCSIFVNFFLMVPLYMGDQFDAANYVLVGVIPFNFVKCFFVIAAFLTVYRFTYKPFSKIVSK